MQKIDDDYHKRKSYLFNYRSEHGSRSNSTFFGNFGQSEREERESVEIDPINFTPDDSTPEFKNKIEEGKSEKQIYDYLKNQYGEWIVYDPEFNNYTLVLWILPIFLFVFGGFLIAKKVIINRGEK